MINNRITFLFCEYYAKDRVKNSGQLIQDYVRTISDLCQAYTPQMHLQYQLSLRPKKDRCDVHLAYTFSFHDFYMCPIEIIDNKSGRDIMIFNHNTVNSYYDTQSKLNR